MYLRDLVPGRLEIFRGMMMMIIATKITVIATTIIVYSRSGTC